MAHHACETFDLPTGRLEWAIHEGDALELLSRMPEDSVDSIVVDPPAGIGFMFDAKSGRTWDRLTGYQPVTDRGSAVLASMGGCSLPAKIRAKLRARVRETIAAVLAEESIGAEVVDADAMAMGAIAEQGLLEPWEVGFLAFMVDACVLSLRAAKPGAHALTWALPRTTDLTMMALRIAGWEIRDSIVHLFGGGFPKSARVNRDPRFCQCAEVARNAASTAPSQHGPDRTGTAHAAGDDAPPLADAHRSTHTRGGYQADCPPGHGSSGGLPHPSPASAQASSPSPGHVRAHSRSVGRGDVRADEPGCSPSQVPRSDLPSMPGCLPLDGFPRGDSTRTGASTPRERQAATGSESRAGSTGHTVESREAYVDGLPRCSTCRKPNADGWGTALSPAHENWILARKPMGSTVAANVTEWGTGGLNIDGTRTGTGDDRTNGGATGKRRDANEGYSGNWADADEGRNRPTGGRWPKNAVLSCPLACTSDLHVPWCPEDELDRQSGTLTSGSIEPHYVAKGSDNLAMSGPNSERTGRTHKGDSGGASRYFPRFHNAGEAGPVEPEIGSDADDAHRPCLEVASMGGGVLVRVDGTTVTPQSAKPQPATHAAGCPVGELDRQSGHQVSGTAVRRNGVSGDSPTAFGEKAVGSSDVGHGDAGGASRFFPRFGYHPKASDRSVPGRPDLTNAHPTHKNPDLMRWLVRLVTPPGGLVLDWCCGSGTTGVAAQAEGCRFVGFERNPEHVVVARARVGAPCQVGLF